MTDYVRSPYASLPPLLTPLERLDDLAAWIEVQSQLPLRDQHWSQKYWRAPAIERSTRCRTTFCAAGYVCERNGDDWAGPPVGVDAAVLLVDGQSMEAQDRAQELLALTSGEVMTLFGCDQNVAVLLGEIRYVRDRQIRDRMEEEA